MMREIQHITLKMSTLHVYGHHFKRIIHLVTSTQSINFVILVVELRSQFNLLHK